MAISLTVRSDTNPGTNVWETPPGEEQISYFTFVWCILADVLLAQLMLEAGGGIVAPLPTSAGRTSAA